MLQLVVVASGDLPTIAAACAAEGLSLDLLGRAEALGIATVTPYRVDLTHPLVASAVYAGIAADERRRLHAVVADSLLPGDGDRRAWHRSEAVLGTDDDVAAELEQVGVRASRRGAFAVASSAHERAGTLSSDPEVRAARFLAAGEAAWLAGEDARAPALLHEAARHAPQPVVRARALAMAGQVAARGGSLVQSRDLLMAAAGDAEDEAPDESLLMYAAVVDVCFYLLDADGARTAAGRAERLLAPGPGTSAGRVGHRVGGGRDGTHRGGGAGLGLAPGRGAGARPAPRDRRPGGRLRRHRPVVPARDRAARDLLGETIESRRRDSRLGAAAAPAVPPRAQRRHDGPVVARRGAVQRGRRPRAGVRPADRAGGVVGRAGRGARPPGPGGGVPSPRRRGHAGRGGSRRTDGVGVDRVRAGRARPLAGRGVRGGRGLHRAGCPAGGARVGDPDLWPGPELVEALVRTGERARAVEVARAFRERAVRKDQPWSLARAARASALLAADDELDPAFGEALRLHGPAPDTFERARTLMLYGARLRRARRPADARGHLQEARAAFDALGARRWSDVVADELEATGLRARTRGTGPVLELTARELQIAELLAEGRTTREAAAALFLSPKTVEYHLRHVYTKLDITSRAELARRLPEVGG